MTEYADITVPITIFKFNNSQLHHQFTNRDKFKVENHCDKSDWIFSYKYEVYAQDVNSTIPTDTQYAVYGFKPISYISPGKHQVKVDISSLFTPHYNRETNTVTIKIKNAKQLNFWLKHYNLLFQIHFNVPTEMILNRNEVLA